MTTEKKSVEVIEPPSRIEGGDVVRMIITGEKVRSERWAGNNWVDFPQLTRTSFRFSRILSDRELAELGIPIESRGDWDLVKLQK